MPGMTSTKSAEWKKFCEANQGWLSLKFTNTGKEQANQDGGNTDETAVYKRYGKWTVYKKTIPLGRDLSSGYINVFTLDGVPDFCEIVWNTKQETAKKAIDQGLSKDLSQLSALGQVRAHLTSWRVIQLQRALEAGRKDHQYDAKDRFLTLVLEMLDCLKPLELLINNYHDAYTPAENLNHLKDQINLLSRQLTTVFNEMDALQSDSSLAPQERLLYQNLQKDFKILKDRLYQQKEGALLTPGASAGSSASSSNPSAKAGYSHELEALADSFDRGAHPVAYEIEQVRKVFASVNLPGTSIDSLGHVLNNLLHGILSLADHANRNATTLQGDFHSVVQAAHYDLERHRPDLQSAVLPMHQGEMNPEDNLSPDDHEKVSLRLSCYSRSLKDLVLIIAKLESLPSAQSDLKTGPAAKWFSHESGGRLSTPGLKPWRSVSLAIKNFFSSPFDFFYSAFTGSHQPFFFASGRFAIAMGVHDAVKQGKSQSGYVHDLLGGLHTAAVPIGVSMGLVINRVFSNLGKSLWSAFKEGCEELFGQIFFGPISDFSYGYCHHTKHQAWLQDGGCPRLFEPARELRQLQQLPHVSASQASSPTAVRSRAASVAALPALSLASAYPLRPYHAKGLLPSMVHGLESFYGLFDRHLFAKHSVTSFIFMGTYLAVFMAVYSPAIFTGLVGKGPLALWLMSSVFQPTGYAFSKGAFFAGIASGFTYAKIMAGIFEKLIHGQSSWMNRAVRNFAHDPGKYTALIMLSTVFGFMVANKYLPIPVISAHLKADAGSVPLLAYFFGGLKLLAIGFESVIAKEKMVTTKVVLADFNQVALKVLAQSRGKNLTQEETTSVTQKISRIKPRILGSAECPSQRMKRANTVTVPGGGTQSAGNTMEDIQGHETLIPWIQRLELLEHLVANQEILKDLPHHRKRDIAEKIRELFDGVEARALLTFIYPIKQRSLIGELVHNTLSYGGLGLRCIGSVVTWSSHPWRDLLTKLESDATANISALWDGMSLILSMFDRIFRVSSDLLLNQIVGRLEFLLTNGRSQCVSSIAFGLGQYLHIAKARVAELCYRPIHALQARQTVPDLQSVVSGLYMKNTAGLLFHYEGLEIPTPTTGAGARSGARSGAAGSYLDEKIKPWPGMASITGSSVATVNPAAVAITIGGSPAARMIPQPAGYMTADAVSGSVRNLRRSASESFRTFRAILPGSQPPDAHFDSISQPGKPAPSYSSYSSY